MKRVSEELTSKDVIKANIKTLLFFLSISVVHYLFYQNIINTDYTESWTKFGQLYFLTYIVVSVYSIYQILKVRICKGILKNLKSFIGLIIGNGIIFSILVQEISLLICIPIIIIYCVSFITRYRLVILMKRGFEELTNTEVIKANIKTLLFFLSISVVYYLYYQNVINTDYTDEWAKFGQEIDLYISTYLVVSVYSMYQILKVRICKGILKNLKSFIGLIIGNGIIFSIIFSISEQEITWLISIPIIIIYCVLFITRYISLNENEDKNEI